MRTLLVVGFLVTIFLRVGLSWLNLRHRKAHGSSIPSAFVGTVDPSLLERMSRYNAERETFGLSEFVVSTAVVSLFFFGGGLSLYDRWIVALVLPGYWQGVTFFVGLSLLTSLFELPFQAYVTFRIEQQHGFNRTTPGLFLADWLKGIFLSTILIAMVTLAGLWLYHAAPTTYWLWLWAFAITLSVTLMLVSPYIIEPLFIKTAPLDSDSLVREVQALAKRAGVTVRQVLKVDASRRTAHSNAYFTGIGRVKRVVLFDTLLEQLSQSELLAVLAHELGHWKLRHVSKRLITMALLGLAALYAAAQLLAVDLPSTLLAHSPGSLYANVVLIAFLGSIAGFFLTPISAYWSRQHEWQADRFAASITDRPDQLASALVKLAKDNLSNLHPHPWYAAFYYSHPTTSARVTQLLSKASDR